MKTQKFKIREKGRVHDASLPIIEIDIPTHCPGCGFELKIRNSWVNGCDGFYILSNTCCNDKFNHYPTIWENRILEPEKPTYPQGVICKRCNARNVYAEPNRPDGSYLCFECR